MTAAVTARRHWGAFRTPWVVRKLRKRAAPDSNLPEPYTFSGPAADADAWVSRLLVETDAFEHPPTLRGTGRQPRAPDVVELLNLPADMPTGGGGLHPSGGSGGGGADASWFDGADELALVIFAVIAVVIVVAVAVPLGLIAIEFLITLALVAAGVVARLIHVKPWTVLVLRGETIVAAVSVTGWRPSRAVVKAVRRHNG